MKVKYDDKQLHLTQHFIDAVKKMMTETILMMRVREPEYRECWVIGSCTIEDMANSKGILFQYGGLDSEYLKETATIFIDVPL